MGFYAPAQLIQDARRHGVEVLPVDVAVSGWESGLEYGSAPPVGQVAPAGRYLTAAGTDALRQVAAAPQPDLPNSEPAVRLGLREIKGFPWTAALRIEAARAAAPFQGVHDLAARAALGPREMDLLAAADALASLAGHRRQAAWQARDARASAAASR